MSVAQAASFYRLRWENEGLFRTYKRTLAKVHLVGRTVRAVHREAYGSLLACQLLLAQGAWALRRHRETKPRRWCRAAPRQALLVMRKELIGGDEAGSARDATGSGWGAARASGASGPAANRSGNGPNGRLISPPSRRSCSR